MEISKEIKIDSKKLSQTTIPFLENDLNNQKIYSTRLISPFDHRLSNDEAEKKVLFYKHAIDEPDNVETNIYHRNADKLFKFYIDLFNSTKVIGVKYHKDQMFEFEDKDDYIHKVLLSIREEKFLKIVMPELNSVILGNFDLLHLLFTIKNNIEGLDSIKLLLKSNSLFLLEEV